MNRRIKGEMVCIGCIALTVSLLWKNIWNEYKNVVESHAKYRRYFRILNKWMKLKEKNDSLVRYFTENNFETIAIYGMGIMGKHLAEELKKSEKVKILYGIDQVAEGIECPFQMLKPDDNLPCVDAVIVTAVLEFDDIKERLCMKLECPIISLEEVLE